MIRTSAELTRRNTIMPNQLGQLSVSNPKSATLKSKPPNTLNNTMPLP